MTGVCTGGGQVAFGWSNSGTSSGMTKTRLPDFQIFRTTHVTAAPTIKVLRITVNTMLHVTSHDAMFHRVPALVHDAFVHFEQQKYCGPHKSLFETE